MADGSNDVTAIRRAALHEVGYAAASRGLKRKDNPYPVPSVEAVVWERGWADYRKKRVGKKRS
jgi:hypothetical protein